MKNSIEWVADIASCHDASLDRAKKLIRLASKSGATVVKFQHWKTEKFINKERFKNLKIGHQSSWGDTIFNIYKKYELPLKWIPELKKECDKNNVEFLISPYDIDSIDYLNKYVRRWKLGSGDLNYFDLIQKLMDTEKEIIIALGCCDYDDFCNLYNFISKNKYEYKIKFLQCLTNYENKKENISSLNLNLINAIQQCGFEGGLSDHFKEIDIITNAISIGARIIERHLSDGLSNSPDNDFAMLPNEWKKMIDTGNRTLEMFGDGQFKIEKAEYKTRKIQRRSPIDNMRPDLSWK